MTTHTSTAPTAPPDPLVGLDAARRAGWARAFATHEVALDLIELVAFGLTVDAAAAELTPSYRGGHSEALARIVSALRDRGPTDARPDDYRPSTGVDYDAPRRAPGQLASEQCNGDPRPRPPKVWQRPSGRFAVLWDSANGPRTMEFASHRDAVAFAEGLRSGAVDDQTTPPREPDA